MMKKNNLENKIKNSFDNHQFQLNHDEIWENIEPELKEKKKRRFFFIWFFGGAMVLGFLFMYTLSNEGASNTAQKTTIESIPQDYDAAPLQVQEKEVVFPMERGEVSTKTTTAANKKLSPTTKTANKVKTAGSSSIENIKIFEPSTINLSSAATSINAIKNEIPKPTTQEPSVGIVLGNTFKNSTKEELATIEKSTDQSGNGESKRAFENITDNNFADSNDGNNFFEVEETDKERKLRTKLTPYKKGKNKSISKKRKSKKKKKKKVKRENDTDEKSKKVRTRYSKRKATYYAQPTFSYIVPFSSLSSRGGEETGNLQIRQDSERRLEAFGFGLNFYRQSRNGFIMVSGIEYQRINTGVSLSSMTELTETTEGVISITENALGQVVGQQLGPKEITTITIEEQRLFNHHTFINVPVGIGKVWKNRKYDVKLLGGLDFNIFHNFEGTIKDVNRDFNFSSRNSPLFESVFKRKTGVGLWLSSEFAKPISKKTLLWVAPRIQIPFSDVNSEAYNLKQKYFNLNVSVGVSLNLM